MRLREFAAAAALLVVGAAHAAIQSFDGVTTAGNGSLVFVMLDSTGASKTGGLIVDLGFNYLDFANEGPLSAIGTTVVWDFSANTIQKNGAFVSGVSNDWASEFSQFTGDAAETRWAILSGSQQGSRVTGFLATGVPSATQLIQQNASVTANMVVVDINNSGVIKSLGSNGTITSADNGAYAMAAGETGDVGTSYSPTSALGWRNNIKWSTWKADGASTNLVQVNANGTESFVADAMGLPGVDTSGLLYGRGTFTLHGNTLTWQTGTYPLAVPEPESSALALVSLALMGVFVRRRAAK